MQNRLITRRKGRSRQRGAAMVELALLLPVLTLILFGIVEFGRAFNAKLTISHAAREGARELALTGDPGLAASTAESAAQPIDPADLTISNTACNSGSPVELTVSYDFDFTVPLIGSTPISMSSTGVMRCE
ncbi:MAG: pilus assembly protein [Acidimicrobiales bacterium]|nr:pilus assembly protein [Acidimicrobiales bacterium]